MFLKQRQHTKMENKTQRNGYCKRIKKEISTKCFWRDVAVEFLATFILMTVQCSVPLGWDTSKPEEDPSYKNVFGNIVQQGLGMGFLVASLSWSFGDFGGCHMNPAVTVSMVVKNQITIVRALLYIPAQCSGAITGAAFFKYITPVEYRESLSATRLHPSFTPFQGVLVELWLTFILVCVIHGSNNRKRKGEIYVPTITIGFFVCVAVLTGSAQTGGSMNPARSLGPAVVMGIWENHWIYWVGPITGGSMASVVFTLIDYV